MDRMTERAAWPGIRAQRSAAAFIRREAALLALSLATALAVQAAAPPRGVTPLVRPGDRKPEVAGNLQYFGGPVVSRLVVVSVLWGPNVDPTLADAMPRFLADVTNSPYMDWLCEYNTQGLSGTTTNQAIGRGTYAGQVMITPQHTGAYIYDSDIQKELAYQIEQGVLPRPENDGQGYPKTLYVIDFPPGVTIDDAGTRSCVDWCAYHGTMRYKKRVLMYAVQPDFGQGSGCEGGCGVWQSALKNEESTTSHELIETVTDPEVDFAARNAPPLGWYDLVSGEIADICNGTDAAVSVNGHDYVVQEGWSDEQGGCVAGSPGLSSAPAISGTSSTWLGGTITLTASGGSPPYQWLVDNGGGPQVIPDRLDPTLTIPNSASSDAGTYYVFSKGSCSEMSAPWPVTLTTPDYDFNFPDGSTLNLCVEEATGAYKVSVLSGALAGTVLTGTGKYESIVINSKTKQLFRNDYGDPTHIVATVLTRGSNQRRTVHVYNPTLNLDVTYLTLGAPSSPPCP